MENTVSVYFQLSDGKDCLPRGGIEKLKKRFASLNFSACLVQRLVKGYHQQIADEGTAAHVDVSSKWDQSGGHTLKLTEDRAKELIKGNTKSWEKHSCKGLSGN